MATKVISVKPGGKIRRRIVKQSVDDRIRKIQKELGLCPKWEALKFQVAKLR
jgi:hypothetical protein